MAQIFMIVWSKQKFANHLDHTHFVLFEVHEQGFKNHSDWEITFADNISNVAFIKTGDCVAQRDIIHVLKEEIFKECKNNISPIFINKVNDVYPSL